MRKGRDSFNIFLHKYHLSLLAPAHSPWALTGLTGEDPSLLTWWGGGSGQQVPRDPQVKAEAEEGGIPRASRVAERTISVKGGDQGGLPRGGITGVEP